jgi:hypothetical protein
MVRSRAKRIALAVAVAVAGSLVALLLVIVNPVPARAFDASVGVSVDELRSHVRVLAGTSKPRSHEHPAAMAEAAAYVLGHFQGEGLDVRLQRFDVPGGTYANVVASYGRRGAPVLVVGAHYDVCGDQPGADDNASGVAAILELGRLLARNRPATAERIELVAFALEEPPHFRTPFMGSAVHADALSCSGETVAGMIAVEMVGYFADEPGSQAFPAPGLGLIYPSSGSFVAVIGNLHSLGLTREVKRRMKGASDLPVWSMNAPAAVPGVDFSDHLNYWAAGFDAVMVTDTAFFRNPNYHRPSDTPDTLDYERMAEVVRGLYAAAVTLG